MSVGFARTFPLKRVLLARGLHAFRAHPGMSRAEQMDRLGIGNVAVRGYVGWLGKTGLRDSRTGSAGAIADAVARFDPQLEDIGTQWVLHYHLCHQADEGGAAAWFHLFNRFLPARSTFTRDELQQYLQRAGIPTVNRRGLEDDTRLVLHCYTATEALGGLGLLLPPAAAGEVYARGRIEEVHPLLVAYVAYDQRNKRYPRAATAPFAALMRDDGNVGKLFLLDEVSVRRIVGQIRDRYGLLTTLESADLDEIGFTHIETEPEALLDRYYNERR